MPNYLKKGKIGEGDCHLPHQDDGSKEMIQLRWYPQFLTIGYPLSIVAHYKGSP